MPEFRLNEATKDWVIIATERAKRPHEFRLSDKSLTQGRPVQKGDCPLCPGNEHLEQDLELLRLEGGQTGWDVRVLPNKFPALSPNLSSARWEEPMARRMEGWGHHEIVIDSRRHNATLASATQENVGLMLQAWRIRYNELLSRPESAHVTVYKNHGERAGTSLEHPHSQIVSMPIIPGQVRHRLEDNMRFFNEFGRCVYCKMLEHEQAEKTRVVQQSEHFTAFVPFAAFSPFHLWILPHRHTPCFAEVTDEEIQDLANVLRMTMARYYYGLNDPDFNLVVQSAAREYVGAAFFHWYLAVVPRLSKAAGFEMGTGMFINTSIPENDARFLREVELP
jgi:UDPglucose--hexose-1-phosphate uridylyltransferase